MTNEAATVGATPVSVSVAPAGVIDIDAPVILPDRATKPSAPAAALLDARVIAPTPEFSGPSA